MMIAHPLQVVRIVSASFKFAGVPGPKAFALRAEHLITAFGFVNENFAIRARFCIIFEKGNGSDGIRIANMMRIIPIGLEFPAIGAGVFVADAALPSGRDKAVAVGISTSMNELINRIIVCSCRIMQHELSFCFNEIIFMCDECFNLRIDIPNLIVNVLDELVMNDGGLCCRKHGLFLCEENVLLMSSKVAGEEGLCESDALNLRMSELNVAEQALGNGDVVATEEGLIT
jgi:hypothetical protein